MPPWTPRHDLACTRIRNILTTYTIASERTLEQKIADAGPADQRIDPHILTEARNELLHSRVITRIHRSNVSWFHLTTANRRTVTTRLSLLEPLHQQTLEHSLTLRIGQTLEIAVFRSLASQTFLDFFGAFTNLDSHNDMTPYTKEEPPSSLSGRHIPDSGKLDFLVRHPTTGYAGIEIKNIRQWLYPDRAEIRALLFKCCCLDVVPVLIARRIQFSTFSVLNPCGVILHQTYNQLYPVSARRLAQKVKDKNLLGYHDVRVGNIPDARLNQFIHHSLPAVLPRARQQFDAFKDLLCAYANEDHDYQSFAARVKRRARGEAEDFPDPEPDPSDYGF